MIKRKRKLNKAEVVSRPQVMYLKAHAYVPSYLTTGKLYKVIGNHPEYPELVRIGDDEGDTIWPRINGCAHIGGSQWDVVWL